MIDTLGLEALTMNSVATQLNCGTMTLYSHVAGKEDLLSSVVDLLIDEMDLALVEGQPWQDVARRIASSYKQLAFRHPHAFELLALARDDQPPIAPYLERILWLMRKGGLSEAAARRFLSVTDGFTSGFLVMAVRQHGQPAQENEDPVEREWSDLAQLQAADAYDAGLEVVLAGIEHVFGYAHGEPGGGENHS